VKHRQNAVARHTEQRTQEALQRIALAQCTRGTRTLGSETTHERLTNRLAQKER